MALLDQARLQRRLHGRAQANAILSLLDLPHADCVAAFLDELRRQLQPEAVALADKNAQRKIRELAALVMPFGIYAGRTYGEIEASDRRYLEWLCDSSQELCGQLSTYLKLTEETSDDESDHT